MISRTELRAEMRHRRRALSRAERARRARRLAAAVASSAMFARSRQVAVYLANDAEMDLAPLVSRLRAKGKSVYLPVVRRSRLWFMPYWDGVALVPNRFGIGEPKLAPRHRHRHQNLDLVLVPLVAFDNRGYRLGMGGGYYDRTFAYLRHRSCWKRPVLIGIGYDFQALPSLPTHEWDVPLAGVATESGLRRFG